MLYNEHRFTFVSMGILNYLVVRTAPWMPKFVVGRVASLYVAGDKLEDGLELSRLLNSKGFSATLDLLGEEVKSRKETNRIRDSYCDLLEGIENSGIDCNVSLKLTALGLRIDKELCWDNLTVVLDKARDYNNFIRLDMEDASVTQATINMCKKAKDYYPKCGTVLQSYMRRTVDDVESLASHDANIRLCKGAYKENQEIAYQGYQEVRDNYLRAVKEMMDREIYIAFATHDSWLINEIEDVIKEKRYPKNMYEFQALSGVPVDKILERLRDNGHKVRYYIPYGPEWHAYSLRRMRENPDIWKHTLKAFIFRSKHRN
ncbi:MAG: proline dehydrogenase family protein [Candidatus Thermoplasmatota archaeon]|nr:proline dehydrogenase family protein [Candidatus Thermoplasmatota archaeon]